MNRKTFRAAAVVTASLLLAGGVFTPFSDKGMIAINAEAASNKPAAPSYAWYYDKTADSVSLRWDSVDGADAYRVFMYDAASKKYVSCMTVKGNTTCTVKGLKSNKTYNFKIAALKKSGGKYVTGTKSETVKVKTIKQFKAGSAVSCPMFSVSLPAGYQYVTEKDKDSISIYDKEAKDAGFGGWLLSIEAYESPADYSGMMDKKIGELKASDGKVYDLVVAYPSDIQYDYEKYSGEMPESYSMIYFGSESVLKTIKGKNGSTFKYGAGMSGKDLYKDVLAKYKKAFTEKWDGNKLEEEDMCSVYCELDALGENLMTSVGYAYSDLDGDGIDELLIGEVSKGSEPSMIYDIYTIVDRKPAHVTSGWYRNILYVNDSGTIINDYSESAFASGRRTYYIVHNQADMMLQCDFRYDYELDEEKPWFISYSEDEDYEAFSEEDFEQRKSNFGEGIHIDFTAFSKVK